MTDEEYERVAREKMGRRRASSIRKFLEGY